MRDVWRTRAALLWNGVCAERSVQHVHDALLRLRDGRPAVLRREHVRHGVDLSGQRVRRMRRTRAAMLRREHVRHRLGVQRGSMHAVRREHATVLHGEHLPGHGAHVHKRYVRTVRSGRPALLRGNIVQPRPRVRQHGSLSHVRCRRRAVLPAREHVQREQPRMSRRDLHGMRSAGAGVLPDRHALHGRQLHGPWPVVPGVRWLGRAVLRGSVAGVHGRARLQRRHVCDLRRSGSALLRRDLHGHVVGVRRRRVHVTHGARTARA